MRYQDRSAPGEAIELADALIRHGMKPVLAREFAQLPHSKFQIEPRRPFRDANSPGDEAIYVRSGIVSQFKADTSGRTQIVGLRFAGEGILPRENPVNTGVRAIVRSEILVLSKEHFSQALTRFPEFAAICLREAQRQATIAQEWLLNCGSRDGNTRIAHLLCEAAARMGLEEGQKAFCNPFTQLQMGAMAGLTSVHVNRVLADLERSGLLRREGRQIIVNDWPEFRRIASFQPQYLS